MQSFGLEPPLASGSKFPFQCSSLEIERVKIPVVAANVERPIRDRRRCRNRTARLCLPDLAPGFAVNCVNISVVAAEENRPPLDHGRRDNAIPSGKFPFHPMELARSRPGINAGVRRISAEHRLPVRTQPKATKIDEQDDKETQFHGRGRNYFGRWRTRATSLGP